MLYVLACYRCVKTCPYSRIRQFNKEKIEKRKCKSSKVTKHGCEKCEKNHTYTVHTLQLTVLVSMHTQSTDEMER